MQAATSLLFNSKNLSFFDHTSWISQPGSSWAFLHSPVTQVDGAASLLVLGDAAVASGRQLLGILGRARHVRCVQAVHGAEPSRLRLGGLDGVADHHEPCIIQCSEKNAIDDRELGGRRGRGKWQLPHSRRATGRAGLMAAMFCSFCSRMVSHSLYQSILL